MAEDSTGPAGGGSLRAELALACRILANEGVSRGAYGHISARRPDSGDFLIKSRGPLEEGLEFATEHDIVAMNTAGAAIDPPAGLDAPREKFIHLGVYERRPEVGCVLHAHPPAIVALTAAGIDLEPIVGAFDPSALAVVLSRYALFDSSVLIESLELGRAVAAALGEQDVCLLRGHGIAVCGADVQDVVLRAVALNELARLTLAARSVSAGPLRPISADDLDYWTNRKTNPAGRLRPDGSRPEWHYLTRRLNAPG